MTSCKDMDAATSDAIFILYPWTYKLKVQWIKLQLRHSELSFLHSHSILSNAIVIYYYAAPLYPILICSTITSTLPIDNHIFSFFLSLTHTLSHSVPSVYKLSPSFSHKIDFPARSLTPWSLVNTYLVCLSLCFFACLFPLWRNLHVFTRTFFLFLSSQITLFFIEAPWFTVIHS